MGERTKASEYTFGGWPRQHFGARCLQIGEEMGVIVWQRYPAKSSITCLPEQHTDKASRKGEYFVCVTCGYEAHADVNAAHNLALWARADIRRYITKGAIKK